MIEDHFYSRIEIAEIFGRKFVTTVVADHRLGVHAQTDVIESHRLNKRDVVGGSPVFKMLFGVALGIVNLRKPLAQVNAVAKMSRAVLGERGIKLGERKNRDANQYGEQQDQLAHRILSISTWEGTAFSRADHQPEYLTARLKVVPSRSHHLANNRQCPYALSGGGVNRIAQCGSQWRDWRLANPCWRLGAGDEIFFDLGRFIHSDRLIRVKVSLHHLAFVYGDLRAQGICQAVNHRALNLLLKNVGIYNLPAVHN